MKRRVQIRRATVGDLDGLIQVVKGTFPQDFDFGEGFDARECRRLFARALSDPNELVVVARYGREVVGFVYYINKPPTNGTVILEMIGVRKDLQGQGIGRKLIREGDRKAVDYFRNERKVPNLATIHLTTSQDNPAGQGLYTGSGYRHVGDIPGFVGQGSHELVMLRQVGKARYRKSLWAKPRNPAVRP